MKDKLLTTYKPGVSATDLARQLGVHPATVRHLCKIHCLPLPDARRVPWSEERRAKVRKVDPSTFDWSLTNAEIARRTGVSRERIRQLRLRSQERP